MKILLLNVNRTGWHSGNMIYDMEAIKKAGDTKVYGPGWDGYVNTDIREIIKQLYGNDKPDIIYSYFYENERVESAYLTHYKIPERLANFPIGLNKVNDIPKIFAISDFWHKKNQNLLLASGFSHCIGCFCPPYSNSKDFFSFFSEEFRKKVKFIPLPRCIDKNCFKDYGLEKKYDVVSLGAIWHFYPLRLFMHGVLAANHEKLGIKYKNYPHCGSEFSHSNFVREEYAKAINGSKILVSCGGRYHVAYNKIFEAMACNTVYVGERPYGEKELHMEDGYNYVAVDHANFVEKIMHYLKNENELKKIADNGKSTFEQYHHIDARAKELVEKLKIL